MKCSQVHNFHKKAPPAMPTRGALFKVFKLVLRCLKRIERIICPFGELFKSAGAGSSTENLSCSREGARTAAERACESF